MVKQRTGVKSTLVPTDMTALCSALGAGGDIGSNMDMLGCDPVFRSAPQQFLAICHCSCRSIEPVSI